jgi:XTP/dITP diphosphohydrolase
MTNLVVATKNRGKFLEICEGLKRLELSLLPLADAVGKNSPIEDGDSYLQNALKKARVFAGVLNSIVLADDSGLEVDALGGRPGLLSSRYSGGSDQDNIQKLMRELSGVPWENRSACFRCALAVATASGRSLTVEGECRGLIALAPRGEKGFGYDSLFYHPSVCQTFGECSLEMKMSVSHRGRALERLRLQLPEFLSENVMET